ncbi:MAG: sugar phosphate isomerase/epimerase [Candidatus Latescibacteria bacterium]|nr:sugar phosphate isomerase/epimerase [Candidatus Latescibacterota bacterium]
MKFIMFTKHLEGLDVPGIIKSLKSVGVEGADLCVRPGYPVNPENVEKALPETARLFAAEGLSIPLVTTPGDFVTPDVSYAERLYAACGKAGVGHIKLGYWHWKADLDYWGEVQKIRGYLEGFQTLSRKHGVKTCIHNHSGLSMGLNSCAAMNLVKGFDPKHIGIFADPGHLSVCGEPVEMALHIVKDYLSLIALKDLSRQRVVRDGKASWQSQVVRVGHGFVEVPTLLRTLQKLNFDGPVSFHSEYSGEPVETVIDLARIDVRFVRSLMEKM